MHPVQLSGDKLHHHALNDPSRDQLSAVAVLSVKARTAQAGCSRKVQQPHRPKATAIVRHQPDDLPR
jgi:hypothetical protein